MKFIVLLIIAIMVATASTASAQSCPCGPACACSPCTCATQGIAGEFASKVLSAAISAQTESMVSVLGGNCASGNCNGGSCDVKLRKSLPLAYVQQSRFASKMRYRHGKRVNRRGG